MSDGVSINTQPAFNANALMEILASNDGAQARVVAFQKAKDEHDKAFAALKIGIDAKKAHEDAAKKLADAEAIKAKAQKDGDAALQALADAKTKHSGILAEAKTKFDETMALIAKARTDHEASVAKQTAELDAKHQKMNLALSSVEKDRLAARAAQLAAAAAQAEAEKAQEAAKAAEVEFKNRAAKLQQALGHIVG